MIFLYSLLFIFIFILLLGLGFIGFGNTRRNPADTTKNSGNRQDGRSSTKWYTYQKRREKIFDKTDGEYVEFEEIKEEK